MKSKPYIGITGFTTKEEINTIYNQFLNNNYSQIDSNYTIMIGIISSNNRLKKLNEGKRSPDINQLNEILKVVPKNPMPAIHYFTRNPNNLASEIKQLYSYKEIYNNCQALQINLAWPDPNQIRKIKEEFKDMKIILQLPHKALDDISRATDYKNLADYCLIDPSGGLGKEITNVNIELLNNLKQNLPNTILGIAGGLDQYNIRDIITKSNQIYKHNFSIDAEGRLRTNNDKYLDYNKTNNYIKNTIEAILNKK
jgi:phosphoribosylanthranilate isomerase